MTLQPFNLHAVHPSWKECLTRGLNKLDPDYVQSLAASPDWLPGKEKIFSAFSLPLNEVKYVLFGESPYPRPESANGYAFWDAAVKDLWSASGLSKKVNRATSLRNFLKMLLIAEGCLDSGQTGQEDIAKLDKSRLIQSSDELFGNLLRHGFLLLNATPVLQPGPPQKDARAWHPFINELLDCLIEKHPEITFVLFGRIANMLEQFLSHHHGLKKICAEHPYNVSFITNRDVIAFFRPLHLLRKEL